MIRPSATAAIVLGGLLAIACAHDTVTAPVDPVSAASSTPPANGRVTGVGVELIPRAHLGPCPVKVTLVGTITSDGPGVAYYSFLAGALDANRDGQLTFTEAGTQMVKVEGATAVTPAVQQIRFLAGMEPRGRQENAEYVDADLEIRCLGE